MGNRLFGRTIGIDYSGAATPTTGLTGLRVYVADGNAQPQEAITERNRFVRWTRRDIAEWLVRQLGNESTPTLVGIDHAFSFPERYFQEYGLLGHDWDHFLDDFREHWPTDGDDATVADIGEGTGQNRIGDPHWLRVTDVRTGTAKSVFRFGVTGEVATSTHAGLPWLRHIRMELGSRVHFWPFDGWIIPPGKSAIAEVYPALWKRRFARLGMNGHQHDAYSVAGWLSYADQNGYLAKYLNPALSPEEGESAELEGWILGVLGLIY